MSTTLPKLLPLTGDTSWIDDPNNPTLQGIEQPLAPARPNATNPLSGWLNDQNPVSQFLKGMSGQMQSTAQSAQDKILTIAGVHFSVVDIVAVIAGLLLLGAALFGFESVRNTTISVAKKGAEVAAL